MLGDSTRINGTTCLTLTVTKDPSVWKCDSGETMVSFFFGSDDELIDQLHVPLEDAYRRRGRMLVATPTTTYRYEGR